MNKLIYKNALIFGSLGGLACFLFFVVLYFTGIVPLYFKMADLGIILIMIWASIWYYKRNMGGFLHFYEAFTIGFLTNIVAALVSGILVFLFVKYIDITPFNDWVAAGKATLLANKTGDLKGVYSESEFAEQLKTFDQLQPSTIILDSILKKTFAGLVPVGLMSMVMRKLS